MSRKRKEDLEEIEDLVVEPTVEETPVAIEKEEVKPVEAPKPIKSTKKSTKVIKPEDFLF